MARKSHKHRKRTRKCDKAAVRLRKRLRKLEEPVKFVVTWF